MQQRAIRVNASEETIKIGPLGIRFLLTGQDSNESVSVFEVLVPVGQKLAAPAHMNDAFEEVLYGIEGTLTWRVDGTPIEVGPGQALCIPRGAVHRFDNLGNEDAKQLAIVTPAIMGPALAIYNEPNSCKMLVCNSGLSLHRRRMVGYLKSFANGRQEPNILTAKSFRR